MEIATIMTMRDGLLRVSEARDLRWKDVSWSDDGSGTVCIRHAKGDQKGEGAVQWFSPRTMRTLEAIGPKDAQEMDRVFGTKYRRDDIRTYPQGSYCRGARRRLLRSLAEGRDDIRHGRGGRVFDRDHTCGALEGSGDAGALYKVSRNGPRSCGAVVRRKTAGDAKRQAVAPASRGSVS